MKHYHRNHGILNVKFNTTSNVRTYGGTTRIYGLTDGLTNDGWTHELIWGGLGNLRFLQVHSLRVGWSNHGILKNY